MAWWMMAMQVAGAAKAGGSEVDRFLAVERDRSEANRIADALEDAQLANRADYNFHTGRSVSAQQETMRKLDRAAETTRKQYDRNLQNLSTLSTSSGVRGNLLRRARVAADVSQQANIGALEFTKNSVKATGYGERIFNWRQAKLQNEMLQDQARENKPLGLEL